MSKTEGNKKSRRAASKAEKAASTESQIAPLAEGEQDMPSEFSSSVVADESNPSVEGEAPKTDVNAESKAKAESNRAAKVEKATVELLRKYPNVTEVTEKGPNGPTRVKIRCSDPQTKQGTDGKPVSVCQQTREIAVQDLFQVTRCAACQDRITRKGRRTRQAKKDKALRAAARSLKQH